MAKLPRDENGLTETESKRQERNDQIIGLSARGVSERQIAATFGVERTTVQRVKREWRASAPTLRNADPLEIIDEMLIGFQADLEELAFLSASAKSDNARIGAINARMVAREKIMHLLQSTGVLPHDLGKLKIEVDVRYIAARLVAIMGKHEVAEDIQRELMEALRGTDGPDSN